MEYTVNIWQILTSLCLGLLGTYFGWKIKMRLEEQRDKELNKKYQMNYLFKMVRSIDTSLRHVNGEIPGFRDKYSKQFEEEWNALEHDPNLKHK